MSQMNNMQDGEEYCCPSSGQDEHNKMRQGEVDIGGEETTTEKLMSPQSEEPEG